MPRWEHVGKGLFFEAARLSWNLLRVREGAIGDESARPKRKKHKSEKQAANALARMIAEKEADGYARVLAPSKRNRSMEAEVLRDLADESAWLVYGDWLQTQGEPRGELIALAKAREQKDNEALARREERLLAIQTLRLPYTDGFNLEWERGFLSKVGVDEALRLPAAEHAKHLVALLESPEAPFVRTLRFATNGGGSVDWEPAISAVARARLAPALEEIAIHGARFAGGNAGALTTIAQAWPRLKRLVIDEVDVDPEGAKFPAVTSLVLKTHTPLTKEQVAAIMTQFPALTNLELGFGLEGAFDALLDGLGAPVRSLTLWRASLPPAKLAGSKLLASLESLVLSEPRIDMKKDVADLVKAKKAFGHLKRFTVDLGFDPALQAAAKRLAKAGIRPR